MNFLAILLLSLPARSASFVEPPPARTQLAWATGFVGATYLLALQDRQWQSDISDWVDDRVPTRFEFESLGDKGTFFELLGTPIGIAGVSGSFYLVGHTRGSPRAKRTAIQVLEASLLSEVMNLTLKYPLGRARPYQNEDPDFFKPFKGQDSFPSGHTAMAFTMATVISSNYPSAWVTASAYTIAGLVGAGRMIQNRHWPSDVVGGAFLGYGCAKLVTWHPDFWALKGKLYSDGRGVYYQARF